MFVFLLLLMILLATTELGTDSWVAALMKPIFKSENAGYLVLIYTAAIMFVLRFCAGPIVHRISPLGLLASCAALAAFGLLMISKAGNSAALVFGAATLYGVGKTFFWPTTLGVVSEQFPKGGAMTINAIGGMGMISAGVLGGALLGAMQDKALDRGLHAENPAIYAKIAEPPRTAYLMTFQPLDKEKERALPEAEQKIVEEVRAKTSQSTLAEVAVLPAIMCVCYLGLIAYFRARGGYKPVELKQAA
jgi:MFS family permease